MSKSSTERNRRIADIVKKYGMQLFKRVTYCDTYSQNDEEIYIFKKRYFLLSSYFDVEDGPETYFKVEPISEKEFKEIEKQELTKKKRLLFVEKLIDKKRREIEKLEAEIDELINIAEENDTY